MRSPMNGILYAHKAFRRELEGLEKEARGLQTADAEQTTRLADRFRVFRAILEGHNAGEESGLWPALEDRFPQISIPYTLDHRADQITFDSLEGLLADLRNSRDGSRCEELCRRLNRQFIALNVTVTHHGRKEDAHLVPLVKEQFSIAEQADMSGLMAAHLAPELMPRAVHMLMRALEMDERVDYIAMVRQGMPPEAFQAMAGWIKVSLPGGEWAELVGRLPELAAA